MTSHPAPAADLLIQYLRALERRDLAAAVTLFTEDATVKAPCLPDPEHRVTVGRANFEILLQWAFDNSFRKLTWTEIKVHACVDPNQTFFAAKASVIMHDGRGYDNEYMFSTRARDGRIVEQIEYFNPTPEIQKMPQPA